MKMVQRSRVRRRPLSLLFFLKIARTMLQDRRLEKKLQEPMDQSLCDNLIESLSKLRKLRSLSISDSGQCNLEWENWAPPPHLHMLRLLFNKGLQAVTKLISPSRLPLLSELELGRLFVVGPEDIQVLGTLPALRRLELHSGRENMNRPVEKFVVGAGAFPCAVYCEFWRVVIVPSMFPRGAMPRLKRIRISLRARDFFLHHGRFGLEEDLSMGHLPSLREVDVRLYTGGSSKEEDTKVKHALTHAAAVHPNRPSIFIF
ncbi:hypothetical protein ACP4OV_002103 [Aristida adscensionis]